jgi:hypothetical protein
MDAPSTLLKNRSALLEIIITASSDPDDIVLDPFVGTGTTAVVSQRLGATDGLVSRKTPSTMKPLAIAYRIPRLP